MKKCLLCLAVAFCSMLLPLYGQSPKEAKAQFDATVKYVDFGGEMLIYQDNKAIVDLLENKLPPLFKLLWQDSKNAKTADCALDSVKKLLNLRAFKAQAMSSVEVEPGVFVCKSFILTDMKARSILIDPKAKNQPMNYLSLPADTRIAIKGQVNFGHIWKLVYAEIKNNPDPNIRQLADNLKLIRENAGIDVEKLISSIDGDIEILLTGVSIDDIALKIVIPDKDGKLANLLKKFIPPTQGNTAILPTKYCHFNIVYEKGRIIAVTDKKLLTAPKKTLASVPAFVKFAKLTPADGCAYAIVDIPQEMIDQLYEQFPDMPEELKALLNIFIQQTSIASVLRVEKDGFNSVSASNISMAQLTQICQFVPHAAGAFMAIGAMSDDEDDDEDDDKASVIKCQNNLKQFITACFMYAADHKGQLPPDLDSLIDKKYITEDICEDIIFLATGLNIAKIKNPAVFPVAICDSFSHTETVTCVAFADGHVEAIDVPEDADEREVISILHKKYKFPAEYLDHILKLLAEEDEE